MSTCPLSSEQHNLRKSWNINRAFTRQTPHFSSLWEANGGFFVEPGETGQLPGEGRQATGLMEHPLRKNTKGNTEGERESESRRVCRTEVYDVGAR